jgi:hypothetical protein
MSIFFFFLRRIFDEKRTLFNTLKFIEENSTKDLYNIFFEYEGKVSNFENVAIDKSLN